MKEQHLSLLVETMQENLVISTCLYNWSPEKTLKRDSQGERNARQALLKVYEWGQDGSILHEATPISAPHYVIITYRPTWQWPPQHPIITIQALKAFLSTMWPLALGGDNWWEEP